MCGAIGTNENAAVVGSIPAAEERLLQLDVIHKCGSRTIEVDVMRPVVDANIVTYQLPVAVHAVHVLVLAIDTMAVISVRPLEPVVVNHAAVDFAVTVDTAPEADAVGQARVNSTVTQRDRGAVLKIKAAVNTVQRRFCRVGRDPVVVDVLGHIDFQITHDHIGRVVGRMILNATVDFDVLV